MQPLPLRHSGHRRPGHRRHPGHRRGVRKREAMRGTGCGATKTCPLPNKSENCRTIPHSAACLQNGSSNFGSAYNISQVCRRKSSCAC